MADQDIKFIGDMERLVVKSGDRFVIKCDHTLSLEMKSNIAETARRFFGDNVKVLILDKGFSLGVIGED